MKENTKLTIQLENRNIKIDINDTDNISFRWIEYACGDSDECSTNNITMKDLFQYLNNNRIFLPEQSQKEINNLQMLLTKTEKKLLAKEIELQEFKDSIRIINKIKLVKK